MTTYSSKIDANYWIDKLQLSEHPEGGYYKETYKADITVELQGQTRIKQQINQSKNGPPRSISSTIYYLLKGKQVSFFHRLNCAEEMWHFYTGSSMTIYIIQETTRKLLELKMGDNPEDGEMFQVLVKRGSWFGAMINDPSSYSLVGCTVCPAFMFEDFELADRKTLISMYPEHKAIIKKLTRSR
jgi:uncharacterized protein